MGAVYRAKMHIGAWLAVNGAGSGEGFHHGMGAAALPGGFPPGMDGVAMPGFPPGIDGNGFPPGMDGFPPGMEDAGGEPPSCGFPPAFPPSLPPFAPDVCESGGFPVAPNNVGFGMPVLNDDPEI